MSLTVACASAYLLAGMSPFDAVAHAFTASIATVGNVGPGLAGVGPMASFAELHPVSRLLLTFNMYAGRLEILTVFVLLSPAWWSRSRRRR